MGAFWYPIAFALGLGALVVLRFCLINRDLDKCAVRSEKCCSEYPNALSAEKTVDQAISTQDADADGCRSECERHIFRARRAATGKAIGADPRCGRSSFDCRPRAAIDPGRGKRRRYSK